MSTIDLSNPKVLRNYSLAQAREGKGKLYIRPEALCFKSDQNGMEFVIPEDCKEEFLKKLNKSELKEESKADEQKEPEMTEEEKIAIREAYVEKTGKRVPGLYWNNIEWIKSKL